MTSITSSVANEILQRRKSGDCTIYLIEEIDIVISSNANLNRIEVKNISEDAEESSDNEEQAEDNEELPIALNCPEKISLIEKQRDSVRLSKSSIGSSCETKNQRQSLIVSESNFSISNNNQIKTEERLGEEDESDASSFQSCEEEDETSKSAIRKRKKRKRFWALADAMVSGGLVCTLGVSCWRGMWGLMDIYSEHFPPWRSMTVGIAIHVFYALLRGPLHNITKLGTQNRGRIKVLALILFGRLYCWSFLCACVLHWRGGWELWLGHVGPLSAPITALCVAALVALKAVRNLIAVPYIIAVDRPNDTYDFRTRYRVSSREPLLFTLDCLFSVVVVGSLVVFVWRGAWDLLDEYLFPNNPAWSAWGSFVLGYGLALVTFLLQPGARRACAHLTGARRLLAADLFLLLSFMATINVWRSVWSLLDIYFLPENPLLSNWITHGGCLILLMLLNCANSVLVRGVYIDAEEEGGKCVVFPCYYLRLFFQKERVKKRRNRLEKAASMAANSMTIVSKNDSEHVPGAMPLLVKVHPATVNRVSLAQEKDQLDTQPNNEEPAK